MSPPSSHPITTSGLTSTVATTKETSETVDEWVDRHDKLVSEATPSGNTLSTTYTSSLGGESITTTRMQDESDEEFAARHQTDYLEAMDIRAPIP